MKRVLFALGAFVLITAGCGGAGDGLAHRFPEQKLAPVPPAEQAAIADALREQYLAERAKEHTAYQLRQTEIDIKVAKNDRKRADLDRDSAARRRQAAEQVADRGGAATSHQAEQTAITERDRLALKLEYLEAHRTYLRAQLGFATREIRAKEARYELAKAEVANSHKIHPKGFQLRKFQAQQKQRQGWASETQRTAASKKQRADQLEKQWRSAGKSQNKKLKVSNP